MNIKRFLAFGLIALMLLPTFVSCNKGDEIPKTPLDAYKQALEKVNSMTSYEFEIVSEHLYIYQGTTEDTTDITETYRTDGNTAYYNMNYNGATRSEYYYVGETLYSTMEGTKEKLSVNKEYYAESYAFGAADAIFTIADSAFDGKEFVEEDGVYYVSVEATPEECAQFLGLTLDSNATCKIGFDDSRNIVSFGLHAVYDFEGGISVDINKTVNFKKFGGVAATAAPADANTYREVPDEETLDKSAIASADKVSVTDEQTDLVMIDVEGYGKIIVRLYANVAPKTVENFKKLVSAGYYDGVVFHRVIKDFMIQGGDRENGDGTGGAPDKIEGEFSNNGFTNRLMHKRGVISMARLSGANDSASSQFFIVHKDSSHLDGEYASFGYVVCGMDVVDKIAAVETGTNDRPVTEVKMNSIKFVKVN